MDGNPEPKRAKRSRPVRVADEIKSWVVQRDLKEGDKLPNEAEMIALFGVSKGTVREALRILEAQGLIATRTGPGGGSRVGKVSVDRAKALLSNYFYFENLTLADIYQMRKVLEPELAGALAGTLSQDQIADLRRLATASAEPAKSAEEEKEQHIASLRFHARLAEFSENALLSFVIQFIARTLTEMTVYQKLYDPPNPELWRKGRDHQLSLVDALDRGDSVAARAIMGSHMAVAERMMHEQKARLTRRFMQE